MSLGGFGFLALLVLMAAGGHPFFALFIFLILHEEFV